MTLAFAVSLAACRRQLADVVREPLIEQLDASHRPTPAAAVVLFGQTGVIVAAAIASYESTQQPARATGWAAIADPSLLTPVLLGLAAGQAAVWLVRGSELR